MQLDWTLASNEDYDDDDDDDDEMDEQTFVVVEQQRLMQQQLRSPWQQLQLSTTTSSIKLRYVTLDSL